MQKYANLVELEKCCRTHIFLAKFRFDTAENEPAKKFAKILLVTVLPILLTASEGRTGVGAAVGSLSVGASAVTFSSSTSSGRTRVVGPFGFSVKYAGQPSTLKNLRV